MIVLSRFHCVDLRRVLSVPSCCHVKFFSSRTGFKVFSHRVYLRLLSCRDHRARISVMCAVYSNSSEVKLFQLPTKKCQLDIFAVEINVMSQILLRLQKLNLSKVHSPLTSLSYPLLAGLQSFFFTDVQRFSTDFPGNFCRNFWGTYDEQQFWAYSITLFIIFPDYGSIS